MDPVSSITQTLRIDKLHLFQDNKQHPPPFSRGQILQGLITGKNNNQFTLDVEGRQFIADSKAPLQTGQRIDLQVTSLSPRITLQILTDPLLRDIGKSLHLLPSGNQMVSQVSSLAAALPENALSSASQQTLAFFNALATADSRTTGPSERQGGQLARLLNSLFSAINAETENNVRTDLSNFLDRLTQALPQQHPNNPIVQLLQQELSSLGKNLPTQQLLIGSNSPGRDSQLNTLLHKIAQLPAADNIGNTLAATIHRVFRNENTSSPSTLLLQLLSLTEDLLQQEATIRKSMPTGRELERFINRLGTNLEQLLATGKQEEAALTLKSAVLDISHAFTGNTTNQLQAEQLTSTLQLYQMLQIKLAGEALFFLPLPLAFFNQGYLLIEPDQKQLENQTGRNEKNKKYSLHLNLEGLGNLHIELHQQAGGMRLRFYAEDATRAKFLSENREELTEWLTATKLESVQFLTGAEDPTKRLLSLTVRGSTGVLNTRV